MERCQSVLGELQCELPANHKGKHNNEGCSWSNAGAACLKADQEKQAMPKAVANGKA